MRRLRLVVTSLLVILAAGYAAVWGIAAQRVPAGLDRLAEDIARHGGSADWQTMQVSGFPFSVTVTAEQVALTLPDGLRWQADRLVARARPWRWQVVDLTLGEDQRVDGPPHMPFVASASGGEGAIHLNARAQPVAAELTLRAFSLIGAPGPGDLPLDLGIAQVTLGVEQDPPRSGPLTVRFDAQGIDLPQDLPLPLGPRIDRMAVAVTTTPPPPMVVSAPALRAWQEAGGRVTLADLLLHWSDLRLSGTGEGGLDTALQPQGRLDLEIRGLREGVMALTESGMLSPRDAAVAMGGIGLLTGAGGAGADGAERPVALPLTLSDGIVRLGPLPLGRVPPVIWPDLPGS